MTLSTCANWDCSTRQIDNCGVAASEERVIVSEDTDFGALLAHRQLSRPSFMLIRSIEPLTPQQQTLLLTANLPAVEQELNDGAIAVLDRRRLRVRPLPIGRDRPGGRGSQDTQLVGVRSRASCRVAGKHCAQGGVRRCRRQHEHQLGGRAAQSMC